MCYYTAFFMLCDKLFLYIVAQLYQFTISFIHLFFISCRKPSVTSRILNTMILALYLLTCLPLLEIFIFSYNFELFWYSFLSTQKFAISFSFSVCLVSAFVFLEMSYSLLIHFQMSILVDTKFLIDSRFLKSNLKSI